MGQLIPQTQVTNLSTTVDGKATIAALNSLSSEVYADGSALSSLQSDVTSPQPQSMVRASTSQSLH